MSKIKFTVASSAILLMAGALAMDGEPSSSDSTITAVAALKANLISSAGLEVDEVRITDGGVACIDYRLDTQRDQSLGHAVVQREEVIKSSSDYERFEKAWNEHCLGPRGGMNSDE